MRIMIYYKSDNSDMPYCAYIKGDEKTCFESEWSRKSFKAAKQKLLHRLRKPSIKVPDPEEVDI